MYTLAILFREYKLVIAYGSEQYIVNKNNKKYHDILKILKEHKDESSEVKYNLIKDILASNSELKVLEQYGFRYENENLYFQNEQIPLFTKIILENLAKDGGIEVAGESISNFFKKVISNPDQHVKEQLYRFLDAGDLPLLSNGNFIAYKIVNKDLKSIHPTPSGEHLDHSIGAIVEMDRKHCDNDPNCTCSTGLHFCSKSYLPYYGSGAARGDKIIMVEVDPKDVTSIPNDYNNAKGRCCKYVVRELIGESDNYKQLEYNGILDDEELDIIVSKLEDKNIDVNIINLIKEHIIESDDWLDDEDDSESLF